MSHIAPVEPVTRSAPFGPSWPTRSCWAGVLTDSEFTEARGKLFV